MLKQKRKIAFFALFTLMFAGCGVSAEKESDILSTYSASKAVETYAVGDCRSAEFLPGRATEVCIPSLTQKEDSKQDYFYGVYCVNKNETIQEYRTLEKIYPASTTKLLTTLLALKYCDLNERVTFSYNATHLGVVGATMCELEEGESAVLGDLLTAFLLCSGNDAAVAIAEHVSGSVDSFVELMNEEAKKLGAVDTHFVNPHGMHNIEHYTTPYDIYLFFNELLQYDKFLSIVSMPSYTLEYMDSVGNVKNKTYENTNQFLVGKVAVPDGIKVIGGKTGTTYAAGCCLTLYFKDEKDNSYIAEVFHMPDYKTLYDKMSELMKQVVSEK